MIIMARSYAQCLPKIAQRVKDKLEQFAIPDGQHLTGGGGGGSNCEMFEIT